MKLVLTLFSFFVIAINGSAQVKKFATAVEYNDFIVSEQVKIGTTINEFITVFSNSKDTTEIHKSRKAIGIQADSSIKQLKLMVPFEGDTALKNNSIRLFAFYSKVTSNEYKQIVWLSYDTKKTSEEKTKEMEGLLKTVVDAEAVYDKNFQDAQKAFAAKYNIQLTENEFKIKN